LPIENQAELRVERFAGREASVNAYVISNSTHTLVVDCLRNREEAADLVRQLRGSGRELQAIIVTHGHPDHFIGSRTLKEAFPTAPILVASEAIKSDIVGFSTWMETVGWLDQQPQMKPKGPGAPDGFDYASQIEVLGSDRITMEGGGDLELRSDFPATECGHMSTIFIPENVTLLTADLTYHGVHAWAGEGVLREHVANWVRVLGNLKAQYGDEATKVLPGHGAPTDRTLFDRMRVYLDDFVSAVDGERTNADALARMKRLYPGFREEGFLLAQSIAFHGPDGRPK
jgi:glyoxylase-like metal-dependent hydrolase (beta-lactamase superfamily II)